jgi:hypothetical protein
MHLTAWKGPSRKFKFVSNGVLRSFCNLGLLPIGVS